MSKPIGVDSEWIKTASGRLRLRADGLIHVEIQSGYEQTPNDAHENLRVAMNYCTAEKRGVLLDFRGTNPLKPETRLVYMDPKMADSFKALALVVGSDKMLRLMANVYMLMARLPFPMRLCLDVDEARDWLQKF